MKLPHLRSEQIKTQPDQTSALINKIIDRVNDPNLGGGGGGGTSDFNQLTNRPSYAGTTMTGSTNIPAVPTKTSQLNNDSGFVNTTDLTNAISTHNTSSTAHSDIRNSITNLSNSVTAIQNVIPTAATANNKLTDKNYVDDSINSVTAYYITKNAQGDPFATKAELTSATTFYSGGQVRIPTRNDYCIVVADESQRDPITGEDPTTRYIYNNGWEFQYIVNKTALTADQLAALNSGVTAADVTKLSGIESGAEVNVQADWTEADNTSDAYIKNKPTIGDATLTVTQNGTSVGTFTANATSDVTLALTDTLYNDFTGATSGTAGAHGLVIAPAAGDQMKALYGDGTWKLAHMTIAAYGKSTYAEILAAYQANNIIYCRASSNSNPGTGNQLRMAFLAYVNNEATPTEFEFQYYRSVATHTDAQQGDQVYVYKINSAGTWSVTVREAYTKVKAGTNMTSSYSSGAITLNATDTTYSDMVGATSGAAGAAGLAPQPAAGDQDKVLKGDGTWDTVDTAGLADGSVTPAKLAGFSTANTASTWVPVSSNDGLRLEHRRIKPFNADGSIPISAIENGEVYDKLAALGGTEITANQDLGTNAFLNVGLYFCQSDATAATLTNCPTTEAFTMRVYQSHRDTILDPSTDQYDYLVREVMSRYGTVWRQYVYSDSTPGTFTYGSWDRSLDSSQIKSLNTQSDAGWSADRYKIPDMSMIAYWNGAYDSLNNSNLKYLASDSVTTANVQNGAITSGKLNDFNTANTVDTWVPVASNAKLQHRVIKPFNSDGSVPRTAMGFETPTIKVLASNNGNSNYWKKLGTLSVDTHDQGSFTYMKIFIGNGNNGRNDQNAYIELIGQKGWTGNLSGRYGWNAILHPINSPFTTSNIGLKIIATDYLNYEIWFSTATTYCRPNVIFYPTTKTDGSGVDNTTFTVSTDAWQQATPTGTECELAVQQAAL